MTDLASSAFVYVLRIRPPASGLIWEIAFNRPPTTAEAICHIQDQLRPGPRCGAPADMVVALECIDVLKQLGVPEHYRAGSQGAREHPAAVELVLMRYQTLGFGAAR